MTGQDTDTRQDMPLINPLASIESLLDLIQQEVYAGILELSFNGDSWQVEWVEAHPSDETYQRTRTIDGDYSDLRDALLRVAELLGWAVSS